MDDFDFDDEGPTLDSFSAYAEDTAQSTYATTMTALNDMVRGVTPAATQAVQQAISGSGVRLKPRESLALQQAIGGLLQPQPTPKPKFNWQPWAIGGAAVIGGYVILYLMLRKK